MTAFTTIDGGFRVAPGRYALVAEDWNGAIADPREGTGFHDELHFAVSDTPQIATWDGLDALIIPIGMDEKGSRGRSLAVGSASIVAFGRIALVALPHASRRSYPFASHIDQVVPLDFERGGTVMAVDGGIDLTGCNADEQIVTIDTAAPGAFFVDGVFVDMADDANAEAFGYGTEEFNAELDEHGITLDLVEIRDRLRRRTDNAGVALLNRLTGMGAFKIAYYAPVAI